MGDFVQENLQRHELLKLQQEIRTDMEINRFTARRPEMNTIYDTAENGAALLKWLAEQNPSLPVTAENLVAAFDACKSADLLVRVETPEEKAAKEAAKNRQKTAENLRRADADRRARMEKQNDEGPSQRTSHAGSEQKQKKEVEEHENEARALWNQLEEMRKKITEQDSPVVYFPHTMRDSYGNTISHPHAGRIDWASTEIARKKAAQSTRSKLLRSGEIEGDDSPIR